MLARVFMFVVFLLVIAFPGLAAEEAWTCTRDGSLVPDTAITGVHPNTCERYISSEVSYYGTRGSVFMFLDEGARDDSAWLKIPRVGSELTVELIFISDLNATSAGAARIQVRHTTDSAAIASETPNGARILLNATLTGEDPYASILGIPPGYIKVMTTVNAGVGEDALVEVRITTGS